MYRLTDDLWTGSHAGPVGPGRDGRLTEAQQSIPLTDWRGHCLVDPPFLARRRRRRWRRAG